MRYRIFGPALILVSALGMAALFVTSASSSTQTIVITRFDDPSPDGCATNGCSFREAISEANSTAGVQVVDIGEDNVVELTSTVTISGDVKIVGIGSEVRTNGPRVFEIAGTGDAQFENVNITGAETEGCGGGIHNSGQLSLFNSDVRDNAINGMGAGICNEGTAVLDDTAVNNNSAAGGPGAGIYNTGTLTMNNSRGQNNTVTGLVGGGDGGAIANADGGTASIQYTLISDNTAGSNACDDCSSGAGISNDGDLTLEYSTVKNNTGTSGAGMENGGTATVRRSTFSGNESNAILNSTGAILTITNSTISGNLGALPPGNGVGGIYNYGSLNLVNDTIVNNTAFQFATGGVFNYTTGGATYKSTIFANNGQKNCNTAGSHVSNGYNIFDNDTCAQTGTDQVGVDPMLGPLDNNGGPTFYHTPLPDSPAIDNGGPGCPTPDQRNAPRVGTCDVGSIEFGGTPITPTPSPSPTPAPLTYPMGDPTCDDSVTTADIGQELKLVAGLDEPDECGRTAANCIVFGGFCYPVWVDTDCNEVIDAADVLWIALHLANADQPFAECTDIGQYPPVQ